MKLSTHDALKAFEEDRKRKEKERKNEGNKTYESASTTRESRSNNTKTNNTTTQPRKRKLSTQEALNEIDKRFGRTNIPTVAKPATVGTSSSAGASSTTKSYTLEDINKELARLSADLDAKDKKYTDDYWQSLFESEKAKFETQGITEEYPNGVPNTSVATSPFVRVSKMQDDWKVEKAQLKKNIMELNSMKKVYEDMALMSAPDFKEYSEKGANIENPTKKEAAGRAWGLTASGGEEVKNPVTFTRENKADTGVNFGGDGNARYHRMTEDEVSVYNYLLAKHGKKRAQEFLDGLEPFLNQREGKRRSDALTGIDIPVVEDAAVLAYDLAGAAANNVSHWNDIFKDEPEHTTAYEYSRDYIDKEWSDDSFKVAGKTPRQWLHSGADTVGNMLPSIALSYATKGVGSAAGLSAGTAAKVSSLIGNTAMGLSAAGSAYTQALNDGYDTGDARTYGVLVGASEAGLQHLLGGISSLGGVSNSRLATKIAAIESVPKRMLASGALSMAGEITEEELQLFIEPKLGEIIFNEEYDAPTAAEMLETAIITFLSTGALEAGNTWSSRKGKSEYGQSLIDEGDAKIDAIIDAGLKTPVGSAAQGIAQQLKYDRDNGVEISPNKLGVLADAILEEGETIITREPTTLEEAAQARVSDLETDRTAEISEEAEEVENIPAETTRTELKPFNVMSDNATWELTEETNNLLKNNKRAVGVVDGRVFLSDGIVTLPIEEADVDFAKNELGAKDSDVLPDGIKKALGEGKPISNPVRGDIPGVGAVHLFATDDGREVAIKKDYAEYFEGYNLEAVFSENGKPYAVRATDNDGNVAGIVMAVAPMGSNTEYNFEAESQSIPFNVMSDSNPVLQNMRTQEAKQKAQEEMRKAEEESVAKMTGFGKHGVQAFIAATANVTEAEASLAARMFNTAYTAGRTHNDAARGKFITELQHIAFEAGQKDSVLETEEKKSNVKNVKTHGSKAGFDSNGAPKRVTRKQQTLVNDMYKAFGVVGRYADGLKGNAELKENIGVAPIARDFQTKILRNGKVKKVSVVYHAAHEIAMHRLMELAPVEGQAFIDALFRHMGVEGAYAIAARKRSEYAEQGVEISLADAMEEVAANQILELYNFNEKKFAEAVDRIVNGKDAKAKSGASKFKQILDSIISKINALLEKLGITDRSDVRELEKIRDLFETAAAAAVAKNKELANNTTIDANGVVTNKNGEIVAQLNNDGTATFSLKTYEDTGRAELNKWLDKKVKSNALTKAEAKDVSEQLEYYYNICKEYEDNYAPFSAWSKAEVVKGLDGKPLMSVVKANGEYSMNLDFSLVCKKRRPLDALYRAMIDDGVMDNIAQLNEVDVAKINEIIRKHGFETACTLCFVDSKRYRQARVADAFVSKYNELVHMLAPKDANIERFDFSGKKVSGEGLHTMSDAELKAGINKLNKVIKEHGETTVVGKIAKHLKAFPRDRKLVTRSDFMDSEGFVRVKKANPNVLKLYNMSKGSGGPKATLPDVQYLGEILKKANFTPKKAYAVGGVRVQSFSDYIPRLVFDYLQMTADLTAKKLPAHAYSKEDIFVMQFGKTGIKINMSLVPAVAEDGIAPGLDKDGNYVWVDGHTFASDFHDKGSGQRGFELAVKIQNTEGYGQNCGTVAVGVSDAHIEKMLKDDNIRMVIPYHLSGLNHFVAQMGNIHQYQDYTKVQNTRYKSGENAGKKITGKDFNFNEAFHRLGDAKAATQEYLAWCEKNDYLPKFDYFAFHEDAEVRDNYYKVLIDFASYDSNGNATPQGAVTMNFPTEGDAFGSMKSLIEKGLEADAVLEGRKTAKIPDILNEVKAVIGNAVVESREAVEMSDSETKFSLREKDPPKKTGSVYKESHITADMSDADRAKILTSKSVLAPVYEGQSDTAIEGNSAKLNSEKIGLVKQAIVAIGEQFGVVGEDIQIKDVDVEIRISKSNLKESVSKKATPTELAKLIPILKESVSNAIGIERHDNRYYYDFNTVYFENLLGGYADGEDFVPVRFGLKHSNDSKATLYVVVDQNKIPIESLDKIKKTEVVKTPAPLQKEAATSASRSVEYKITQIIPFVKSKDLLRYIPDNMLTTEQKTAKWEAIAETIKYTADKNDKKYAEYIKNGNIQAAREMVMRAAKAHGYSVDAYHGTGADFDIFTEESIGKRNVWGKGFYFGTNKAIADDYASWRESKGGKYRIISAYLKMENPYIHRESDIGTAEEILDRWFPNRWKTARELGIGYIQGKLDNSPLDLLQYIAEDNNVEIRDVLREYGYDSVKDGGELVVFASNQIKSSDPITYDDDGNIIPISQRFNEKSDNIKFSLRDSTGKTLTKAQQEYFKDSKVRDENGNLLVMYHGTSNGGFTVFDTYAYYSKFGLFGNGAYFTDNKDIAEQYTRKGRGKSPQVYSAYLNITNPIDMDAEANIDAWNSALQKTGEDFSLLEGEMTNETAFKRMVEDLEYAEVYTYDAAEIVRNVFENMGYDGITHIGGGRVNRSDGTKHRVYIAFEQEQVKDVANANPTAHPDINFSLRSQNDFSIREAGKLKKALADKDTDALAKYVERGAISLEFYDQMVEEFGVIPTGEKPHRNISVPRKTSENKKVSQTVRTILEAKATPDEAVPTIEKMVEDGVFSYDVYTDKEAISNKEKYLREYGWEESLDDWFDAVNNGEVSKDNTVMGWALYNNAANIAATTTSETERTTAIKTSLKILDAMVKHQRSAAQALQATRILKKMSPETQLYGIQKSVSAFQKELTDKYGDKAPNLQIDEELAEQFIKAKTPEERAEVEAEIYKDIGRQMPSRFIDKWNAWRYLAMLGNPRTHIRNIGGNAGFAPIVALKNLTATTIESVVHRVSGGKTARTKSFVGLGEADRALLKAAWDDYANVADMISNGGKYNDFAMANQQIEAGRQIFKFKPLEWARKGNSKALEAEDMWFAKPHYANALAQYCKANNITAEQLKRGKALGAARQYAIKEAQKATYRDTNAFSQWVSEVGRKKSDNFVEKSAKVVLDGIMPFRKTPANILVRGLEYSPLGLLKGLSFDLYQVSKGKKTSAEAIDSISAGLTGTGLLALGMWLAAEGLIRGHGEDDEDEKKFKELMGHQAYSLELPNGTSVTLDWLAPEALPFFVGVNLWEATRDKGEEMTLSTMLQTISGITEPMLEMSCLQSINDVVESVGYASSNDTSAVVAVLSSAATSYLTQALPTILGQAERTGEEYRMTTYTEKNRFLTSDMQYTLGKASAKLPLPFVDYSQIPYIDAWGRKEASGSALKRGLNNFLNPAYTSTIETSSMEKELLRLFEKTGESGVFPERADKYFMVDEKRKDLTAEEYVRYATLKGEKSYKLVSDLMKSKAYKSLSNEEKVDAIKETYDYANQKAKQAISKYKPEKWVSNADKFGDNVGNYISFKTEVSSAREDNGGKISKEEVVDIILDMAENDTETWNMYLSVYDSEKDMYVHDNGVDGEDYMNFHRSLDKYDKPTKSGTLGSYTQDEATEAIRNLTGVSNRDRAILWKSVNKNWKDKNNPWRRYLP